jgi:CRP-like cAMP-binding protein
MIPGSYFGEIEILFRGKREFTVTCESETELFYLSRYDFENTIVKEFPHIVDQMKILAKKRKQINQQSCLNVTLNKNKVNGFFTFIIDP